jgi:hypothetical protein
MADGLAPTLRQPRGGQGQQQRAGARRPRPRPRPPRHHHRQLVPISPAARGGRPGLPLAWAAPRPQPGQAAGQRRSSSRLRVP